MYQVPEDNRYSVAFRADDMFAEYEIGRMMINARRELGDALIDCMIPGQWYAVRWSLEVLPRPFMHCNEYRLAYELNEAQTERLVFVRYDEMPLGRLALTAVDEFKRRWRGRFASWGRFFDWLEEAQGWR